MRRILAVAFICLLASLAQAQTAGPALVAGPDFDRKAALDNIFAELKLAENDSQARYATQEMWLIYLRAPDAETANDMNRALRARGGYSFDKALAILDNIVARHPDYAEAKNQRATIYFLQERFEESVTECEAVLALAPRHLGCLTGMAIMLIRHLKRYQEGRDTLARALNLHPRLPEKYLLGEIPTGE